MYQRCQHSGALTATSIRAATSICTQAALLPLGFATQTTACPREITEQWWCSARDEAVRAMVEQKRAHLGRGQRWRG